MWTYLRIPYRGTLGATSRAVTPPPPRRCTATPAAPAPRPRPKVGEIKGKPFKFPAAALAPLAEGELKEWGL